MWMSTDDSPAHGALRHRSGLPGLWRLWLVVLLSGLVYLGLAYVFPLIPNAARIPPADIRTFAPSLGAGLLYAAVLVGLFGLLIVAFRQIWMAMDGGLAAADDRALVFILIVAFALGLPLVFVYPINAIDVYTYYLQGRVAAVHGANPYLVAPAQFVADPTIRLAGEWVGETPPYGPLWVLLASGVAAAATLVNAPQVLTALLLFKLLGLVFFVLSSALLGVVMRRRSRHFAAFLVLYAWNPALYMEFVANAHNDVLMLLFLLAGYWLIETRRPAVGFLVMVLAVLTKPIALLALPLFFFHVVVNLADNRARLRFAAAVLVGSILLSILSFLPFLELNDPLSMPLGLVQRLVREAGENSGFSVPVLVWFALGMRVDLEMLGLVATAAFVVFYVALLVGTLRGRSPARMTADAFVGYLVAARGFRIWYAVWPFPWLLLDAAAADWSPTEGERFARYWRRAGFWFLLTAQLSVVIYGHIRVYWLAGQQPLAHLIGVPFTFLLPLWLARYRLLPPAAGLASPPTD